MYLQTLAVVCVVCPFSLICLALDLCEFSIAVGVSQVPCSLVRRTILEEHSSTAMAESTEPVALVRCTTRLIPMLFLSQLFSQLCLIHIEQQVQLYYSSRINCLIQVLYQELRRLFPAFITSFFIPHTLKLSPPVCLDFNDPSKFRLQYSVKLNARVVANCGLVLRDCLICICAATCRERLGQLLSHIFIY